MSNQSKAKTMRYIGVAIETVLTVWIATLHITKSNSYYQLFLGLAMYTAYLIIPVLVNSVLQEDGLANGAFEILVYALFLLNYGYILFRKEHSKALIILLPILICFLYFIVAKIMRMHHHTFGKDAQIIATIMVVSSLMTAALPVLKTEIVATNEVIQMTASYLNTGMPYPEVTDTSVPTTTPVPNSFNSLKKWDDLNNRQKTDLLEAIIEYECSELGISYRPKLKIEELPVKTIKNDQTECIIKTNGFFNNDERTITLNNELISDGRQIVKTLLHETNHTFIYDVCEHIDWSDSYIQTSAFFKDLTALKHNEWQYIRSEKHGYQQYYDQPLEEAARAYSEERFVSMYEQFFS